MKKKEDDKNGIRTYVASSGGRDDEPFWQGQLTLTKKIGPAMTKKKDSEDVENPIVWNNKLTWDLTIIICG